MNHLFSNKVLKNENCFILFCYVLAVLSGNRFVVLINLATSSLRKKSRFSLLVSLLLVIVSY